MGLDQYAYATDHIPDSPVDFAEPEGAEKIAYWRKHPDLHGWMERLYWARGGEGSESFFGKVFFGPVALMLSDLDALEADVLAGALPPTTGFFFGESVPEDCEDDLRFVATARAAIAGGRCVYYSSSW